MTIYRGIGSIGSGAVFVGRAEDVTIEDTNGYISATNAEDAIFETAFFKVDGITGLKALTPISGERVYLKYHTSEGDGGHGIFRGITGAAPGTYTDDNGITIRPTGGDGSTAWVRDVRGPVNIKWYGAVGDWNGSTGTDDTTAIQSAINYASFNESEVYIPEGRYAYTRLYTYYDAVNNPGFTQGVTGVTGGRITIRGSGCGRKNDFINGEVRGSILDCTSTTGIGFSIGDGTTNGMSRVIMDNIALWGGTTGSVIKVNYNSFSKFSNMFVGNSAAGDCFLAYDCWTSSFEDIFIYGSGPANGKIAFHLANLAFPAGNYFLKNVNGENSQHGVVIGGLVYDVAYKAIRNVTAIDCQGISCGQGIVVGSAATNTTLINPWTEQNATVGMRIHAGAFHTRVVNGYSFNDTATEADIALGNSGGTANETAHPSTLIENMRIANINAKGIVRYVGANDKNVYINNCRFSPKTSSVGIAIDLIPGGATAQHGITIDRPEFAGTFATNINGISLVDLLITEDTLGEHKYVAPVRMAGAHYADAGVYKSTQIATITTNTTLTSSSPYMVLVNATAGAITITLPDNATSKGQQFMIKKTDASANAVTVSRAGSDLIDNGTGTSTTQSLAAQMNSIKLISGGNTVWYRDESQ